MRLRAAMHPILNYVKFRTNHEPNVVHGVVRAKYGALIHVRFRASHAPYVVHGGEGGIRTHVRAFGPQVDFESTPLRPLRYLSDIPEIKKPSHRRER